MASIWTLGTALQALATIFRPGRGVSVVALAAALTLLPLLGIVSGARAELPPDHPLSQLVLPGPLDACDSPDPKPWDYDPGPAEAALKAAVYELRDRWSEEPTPRQLAMDAIHYDLTLDIDINAHVITGALAATFRVAAASADSLDLDLVNQMTVTSVTAGASPAGYIHQDEILTIALDRTYLQDELVTVAVGYFGNPPGSYGAWGWDSHNSIPHVWTLSEPFGSRSWWPCDDWSDDKADSVDLHITVPQGQIVASNGTLRDVTYGATTDTYYWHESNPISTYLVSLAIYPYTVYSDYYHYTENDSMEITFFIFPDDVNSTLEANLMVNDMIDYFADVFGEYPFLGEKYGHAEFNWGGAMEHQTCTSIGAFYETIIAHELGHQWFGDQVTCATFNHVWIQEGLARYCEALWMGYNYGPEGYWGRMNAVRYYGSGTIYVPDLNDWGRIFHSGLSYNKGSWVVHMLRHVIGDENFFAFLPAYLNAFSYGVATTEDLQAVAESISGMDLSDFFQQWIYGEYFPIYGFTWENVDAGDHFELHLTVDQLQTNTGVFHMPIDIVVDTGGDTRETFVIDNAQAHQEYVLNIGADPAAAVELDPEGWILKQVQEPVVNPTFADGVLLVNGVDWASYGTEITSAYEDRAFWGDLEISFWDCFAEPAGGYPSTLPAPLGHGRVPSTELGRFETVLWIGNNYNGDLASWINTSILFYLEAGGDVLLMTRNGDSFLSGDLMDYLGITPISQTTIYDCIAAHPELTDIARIGTQNGNLTFYEQLATEESELLYRAQAGFNPYRGIGALRTPSAGGTHNPLGGHFAFLSGRPYRWNHADLAANVETIVLDLFTRNPAAVPGAEAEISRLALRLPNPAGGTARLDFDLPAAGHVHLAVYDCQGRLARTLLDAALPAGRHAALWDGRTSRGQSAPTGLYFVQLLADGQARKRPLLLLR